MAVDDKGNLPLASTKQELIDGATGDWTNKDTCTRGNLMFLTLGTTDYKGHILQFPLLEMIGIVAVTCKQGVFSTGHIYPAVLGEDGISYRVPNKYLTINNSAYVSLSLYHELLEMKETFLFAVALGADAEDEFVAALSSGTNLINAGVTAFIEASLPDLQAKAIGCVDVNSFKMLQEGADPATHESFFEYHTDEPEDTEAIVVGEPAGSISTSSGVWDASVVHVASNNNIIAVSHAPAGISEVVFQGAAATMHYETILTVDLQADTSTCNSVVC